MKWYKDLFNNKIRFSNERALHIKDTHPEMYGQFSKIKVVLSNPDEVLISKTDAAVCLYYKKYKHTPVTDKYLCVVVKTSGEDNFIITVYFTDKIKRGKIKWKKIK